MIDLIDEKAFRVAFEAKGRFQHFVANIPTYILNDKYPGLKGAAKSLQQMIADDCKAYQTSSFHEMHSESCL